ncbi:hypothetical protein DICVIV_00841 [Dictyocaulus viviparus]|uniref:AAA+ ATPase domain-containing protein n=1 Tax=Dictyocaulus viviparus TaxID=29172 RepID=A0A0D8Y9U3_DICVI|nr:hypothetical protein DICVIV_00841 [Dictyocaulus viviparus]
MVKTRSQKVTSEGDDQKEASRISIAGSLENSTPQTVSHKKILRDRHLFDECGGSVKALHGREKEFSKICGWIQNAITDECPLSIYISGSPGTGKSATIGLVCQHFGQRIVSTILNCASIRSQTEIIRSILHAVGSSARPSLSTLSSILKGMEKHFVLILDEVDHLVSKTNSFLYTAFQWPQSITTKLVVIGISNSIDLTERLLPKLKIIHSPKTLVFAPYSKDEILEILKKKFSTETDFVMDSSVLELCARKVAAMSGDIRAAFHIMKQTRNSEKLTVSPSCRQVLGILNNVYSSPVARAHLPLQPRLLLAVAVAMLSNKKVLNITSLTNAYSRACDVVKVPQLEGEDFTAALQILESQSFITQGPGGSLVLQVNATTAKATIADNAMMAQISQIHL